MKKREQVKPVPCRCGASPICYDLDDEWDSYITCGSSICIAATPFSASLDRAIAIWNAMQSEAKRDHDCT